MEETTTDADLQEPQALDAQPVEQPAEAVDTPDSEPQQQDEGDAEQEPDQSDNSEDDVAEFLSKKGIDLSTPEGQIALAKSYREAEKALSRKAQEASQLKKSLGDQPATTEDERIRKLELGLAVNDWKESKGITSAQDQAMGDYLSSNPQKNLALQYGILTLDDIYAMSGAGAAGQQDPAALKKQGSQEALRTLANKQRATAPKGNASNNTLPQGLNKSNVETWYEGLGPAGRQDPANQAKLASILGS